MRKVEVDLHEYRLVSYVTVVPDDWSNEDVWQAINMKEHITNGWEVEDDVETDDPVIENVRFFDAEAQQERLC